MTQPSPKARVLVVEDNEDVRRVVVLYLRSSGYGVDEAQDGQAGLEAAIRTKPDLILLDVLLPRLDGIETLRRLRADQETRRIPVVMMSAVLQTRDLRAETASLDVASFLQKPFQVRNLLDHVEKALSPRVEPRRPTVGDRSAQDRPQAGAGADGTSIVRHDRTPLPESGSLEEHPIPYVIQGIFVSAWTGCLVLHYGTTEKKIYFQNGWPVYAESSIAEETLGAHLLSKGLIDEEQHDRALSEMTSTGRRFGECLLKLGHIGPHDLFTEIEAHLAAKVVSTFGWFSGKLEMLPGDSWKDDVIVARMKPGRILLDGIQKYWSPNAIHGRLGITKRSATEPLGNAAHSEDQIGFTTQEIKILQMARRQMTLEEIIRGVGDIQIAVTTLFALYVMELIGFVVRPAGRSVPPKKEQSLADIVGAPAVPKKEEHADALLSEYIKYRNADYFKLLGVSRDATGEEITRAFKERQRRYHPDTLIGIDTGLVHEKVEELFIRVHTAYKTLLDPDARKKYVAKLDGQAEKSPLSTRPRTGRQSVVSEKDEHERCFEDGFSLLRSGEPERAADLFERAEKLSSKPRYRAYRFWALYLADPMGMAGKAERALRALTNEAGGDPQVPHLLGNFYLREKDTKKAIHFFEIALERDPKHIDSARQLRILRMRQSSTEHSGLFDLFKKRK